MRVLRVLVLAGLIGFVRLPTARAVGWPVFSLHPLVSGGDCDGAPDLTGDWDLDILGPTPVRVQKLDDCRFQIVSLRDNPQPETWSVDLRLARLGSNLFFDLTSQLVRPDGTEILKDSLWLPTHFFGTIRVHDGVVRLSFLDDEWLKETIKTGKVDFVLYDQSYVLTGATDELQDFVTSFASDPKAFAFDLEIKRIAHEESQKQ